MDSNRASNTALFDVYLRLRPQSANASDKFIELEPTSDEPHNYITIKPPASDYRKRAVERFGFTKVFEEQASQLDIFNGTSLLPLIEGVLAPEGKNGRDGLLATLGVTGSGKVGRPLEKIRRSCYKANDASHRAIQSSARDRNEVSRR